MNEIYMVPLPGDLEKDANLRTVWNVAKAPFVGMGKNLPKNMQEYVSKHIHRGSGYERGRYNQLTGLSPTQKTVKNLPGESYVAPRYGDARRVASQQQAAKDLQATRGKYYSPETQAKLQRATDPSQIKEIIRSGENFGTRFAERSEYMARRAADALLQRGQFNSVGERLMHGRLGAGFITGQAPVLASRALQGGLFGRGGIVRGAVGWDPRLGMYSRDLAGALKAKNYGQAMDAYSGLVGSGLKQTAKAGLMVGLPLAFSEVNPETGRERTALGTAASTVGSLAAWPLGVATWGLGGSLGIPESVNALAINQYLGNAGDAVSDYFTGEPEPSHYQQPSSRDSFMYSQARPARPRPAMGYRGATSYAPLPGYYS